MYSKNKLCKKAQKMTHHELGVAVGLEEKGVANRNHNMIVITEFLKKICL